MPLDQHNPTFRGTLPQSHGKTKNSSDYYACCLGCGTLLKKGLKKHRVELSQLEHNKMCPVNLKIYADMEKYKRVQEEEARKNGAPEPPPASIDLNCAKEFEGQEEGGGFQYCIGFYKLSKKASRGRRSILLDPSTMKIGPIDEEAE